MSNEIYAATYTESTYVPGDERSERYPGHGYPAHTVDNLVFKQFADQDEMVEWARQQTFSYGGKKFKLYKCIPLVLKTEFKVSAE